MNVQEVKALLADNQIKAKQSLGQNFLVSDRITEQIITLSDLHISDRVLEIGPGLGALTESLLLYSEDVLAIEIDQRMVYILEKRFAANQNFRIVHNDILKENLNHHFTNSAGIKVIANLPYYITSDIIEKLIVELPYAASFTLMIQKEASERIRLRENDSRYGVTAILLSLFGNIEERMLVAPSNFYPCPKVASEVLLIKNSNFFSGQLHSAKLPGYLQDFQKFLKLAFSARRKTLLNNLKQHYSPELLINLFEQITISQTARPEQISPRKFWQLYAAVAK